MIKLSDKVITDQLTAVEFVQPMEELENIILGEEITLTTDVKSVVKALSQLVTGGDFFTATGSSQQVLTGILTRQPIANYVNGMRVRWRPSFTNVTTITINVDGLGAKSLLRENGDNLQPGDLSSIVDALARYDTGSGGRFLLLNPHTPLYPKGYHNGFRYKIDSGDTDHDVEVGPGECADSTGTFNLVLAALKVRSIDGDWTFAGGGGMPTALTPPTVDTWLGVYIIGGGDAVTSWGYDTDPAAAALLTLASSDTSNTYDKYRLMGHVLTDGSSNIIGFRHSLAFPNTVIWDAAISVYSTSSVPTTRIEFVAQAPPDSIAYISHRVGLLNGAGSNDFWSILSHPAVTNLSPDNTNYTHKYRTDNNSTQSSQVMLYIECDSISEISLRHSGNHNGDVIIMSLGFVFDRSQS